MLLAPIICLLITAMVFAAESVDSQDELFAEYEQKGSTWDVPDPLFNFNYAMYQVNDKLYFWVLKPVAQGYNKILPQPVRQGVKNVFYHIGFPIRFVNCLLQGKFHKATTEVEIFLINTTAGVCGIGKPAQNRYGKINSDETLGQTFGAYAIKEGFYIVLPFLGPTTLRDVIGSAGDYFLDPSNYIEPWKVSYSVSLLDTINSTSFRIGDYEALKEASLDHYTAMKDGYIQLQRLRIDD